MKSKIIRIGKDAVNEKEPILILFGDRATAAIENVSVIQTFTETAEDFQLVKGDIIRIGDQDFTIEHVGNNVQANLNTIGHITIVFSEFNENHFLETSVYASPHHLPRLEVGMEIQYQSNRVQKG
ncbi:PTS glucitol/sorbitol transporter subunit IIA [Jeotgalibaca caeni]|uniref:PTS glucitol/sorbitol transporter subunit IIA n=1 Tax=Jeotgalibaca caeni TaxID=3028623 RepID=UPI00237DF6D2|nr:PTS glucitol/sorbitol transporter subunit IIA [Jeotgalibaca caeni]MDE1549005.1 PTS glucitol/sorbitol transporter subunit IIA [Jeotgalibaca caeni]